MFGAVETEPIAMAERICALDALQSRASAQPRPPNCTVFSFLPRFTTWP